jgi:hypothetical protein
MTNPTSISIIARGEAIRLCLPRYFIGKKCKNGHVAERGTSKGVCVDCYDFKRAWALSNLQPLWAIDNQRKSAKLAAPFQPSLI